MPRPTHQNLASGAESPQAPGREHLGSAAAQIAHRLLSLEAVLEERAQGGAVSSSGYARRRNRLGKAHAALAALRQLVVDDSPERRANYEVGLPVLETCTPPEKAVCEDYLTVRGDTTAAAAAEAATVHRWLQDAAGGRANALQTTLRLAKLRKLIAGHEDRFTVLTAAGAAQERQAEAMLAHYKGRHQRSLGRTTLDGLVRVYEELDAAIGRVARLQGAFKREELKARKMSSMIKGLRARLSAPLVPVPPPATGELIDAALETESFLAPGLGRTRERRALVDRFWEDVLRNPPVAPAAVVMAKAAHELAQAGVVREGRPGKLPPLSAQYCEPEILFTTPGDLKPASAGPSVL